MNSFGVKCMLLFISEAFTLRQVNDGVLCLDVDKKLVIFLKLLCFLWHPVVGRHEHE